MFTGINPVRGNQAGISKPVGPLFLLFIYFCLYKFNLYDFCFLQKWTRDDYFCVLQTWNSRTSMIEIERVLNRSENAWESRVYRLRHDQLIGSINGFFDGLSAKLDIDPRGLKNKVDVVLDDEKYKELKVRVNSRLDDTVIKVDAFLMIVQVLLIRIFRS